MKSNASSILISRTDSIGDVILTLPMAAVLKEAFPECYIGFLGKMYTAPVIRACTNVDEFVNLDDFLGDDYASKWDVILHVFPQKAIAKKAKQLGIQTRIGTTNRLYHWLTCNKLVKLSRKNSDLHEAQLNLRLLKPLDTRTAFEKEELFERFSMENLQPLKAEFEELLRPGKTHVILHPKSQGSAREWGLANFARLAMTLNKSRFQVFISGTEKERALMQPMLEELQMEVTDITGLMNLDQFISFIAACDALVAASTGPLHIAAALGKSAIGLYPPIRPMHAGRWGPLGTNALSLTAPATCEKCRKKESGCDCMGAIPVADVVTKLSMISINQAYL